MPFFALANSPCSTVLAWTQQASGRAGQPWGCRAIVRLRTFAPDDIERAMRLAWLDTHMSCFGCNVRIYQFVV